MNYDRQGPVYTGYFNQPEARAVHRDNARMLAHQLFPGEAY